MSTTVDQHTVTARVTPLGLTLDVDNASLTLDEGWSPYAQAQLVCKLPDAAGMEALDLRTIPLRARPARPAGLRLALVARPPHRRLRRQHGRPHDRIRRQAAGRAVYTKYSHPWNSFGRLPVDESPQRPGHHRAECSITWPVSCASPQPAAKRSCSRML